jgi:hypothetical protein
VPDPSPFEVEIAITKLKTFELPGIHQVSPDLIQAGGEMLLSEIHKFTHSVWNKEKLPQQCKQSVIVYQVTNHCYQLHTKLYQMSSQG